MAYVEKFDGQTDKTIQLGDKNNPVKASIEGYFLGTKETPDTGYGPGKLHIFKTKNGTIGVWGKTNSNRLMTADLKGQMCLLTFTGMGEKKKGKNPAYNYSLKHDPLNTIEVAMVEEAPIQDEEEETGSTYVSESSLDEEEESLDSEEEYLDEAPPARASAPKRPVAAPDAARAAKVQALLSSGRTARKA